MRMFAIALAVCITASAQGPIAVTNASSGRVTPGVAPGSFASVYGDFRGVTATSASTAPFPTTLGGVSVTLGTTPAPVQFAGP